MDRYLLFTNRNQHSDFILSAIERFGRQSSVVKIAVPFFTDIGAVEWLTGHGCQVRLIVRLGFPTNADALGKLLRNESVQVRYFTDSAFVYTNEVRVRTTPITGVLSLATSITVPNFTDRFWQSLSHPTCALLIFSNNTSKNNR